ncbi:MAG: hypothetical protein HQ538_02505 [Parcubacteria group bacterium]|nr:hypothetical protein [Parcubacteria group bacterium]
MNDKDDLEKKGLEQINFAANLRSKFFFHWSILSGATITLIIPLILEIKDSKGTILNKHDIKTSIILLLSAIIFSSIRNFFAAHGFWKTGMSNVRRAEGDNKEADRLFNSRTKLTPIQLAIETISITSYIFSLVLLYLFISKNLL